MFEHDFGQLLRGFRERQNIDIRELADEVGVSRNTISAWESGKQMPRERDIILKIQTALGLSNHEIDQLLDAAGYAQQYHSLKTKIPDTAKFQGLNVEGRSREQLVVTSPSNLSGSPPKNPGHQKFALLAISILIIGAGLLLYVFVGQLGVYTGKSSDSISIGNNSSVNTVIQSGGGNVSVVINPGTPTPPPTLTPAPVTEFDIDAVELLSEPWYLVGNNGDAQHYFEFDTTLLKGMDTLRVTYDLHGLKARGRDAAVLIFDQPALSDRWYVASFADYGKNEFDGVQIVDIPLSNFRRFDPDDPDELKEPLNFNQKIGTLHTRFWSDGTFEVEILSIVVYNSNLIFAQTETVSIR